MNAKTGVRILTEELKAMEIRAKDRGEIKGEFECHFGVMLPKTLIVTQELCGKWNVRCNALIRKRGLGPTQESAELDTLFQKFFKVSPPFGRHLTPEMCYAWRDKHQGYLMGIWVKRFRMQKSQRGNDSS